MNAVAPGLRVRPPREVPVPEDSWKQEATGRTRRMSPASGPGPARKSQLPVPPLPHGRCTRLTRKGRVTLTFKVNTRKRARP